MRTSNAFAAIAVLALAAVSAWSFLDVGEPGDDPGANMTEMARVFLNSLDDRQRAVAQLDFGSANRVQWHFIPMQTRKGLALGNMNQQQRRAAHAVLQASLSEIGYGKAAKIMQLESLLHELEERAGSRKWDRDSNKYYVTLFGTPNEASRWGLSFEGHHLSLNFVVDKNRVVSTTPTFFAANPAVVKNRVENQLPRGTRVLANEETLAFRLVKSLTGEQRQQAVIADTAPREIRAAGEAQPPRDAAAGIAAADLTDDQTRLLRRLIIEYANNLPERVAGQRIQAIRQAGFGEIHFAWAGADEPGVGHYYRIQGPTFLIEFVNTQPDAAGNPANHIHSVWRDPTGDFAIPITEPS